MKGEPMIEDRQLRSPSGSTRKEPSLVPDDVTAALVEVQAPPADGVGWLRPELTEFAFCGPLRLTFVRIGSP